MKKIPTRKCTGCSEMKEKKELIRIVYNNKEQFRIDFIGKEPGRGAYICKNIECLQKAQKIKGLERSFKTKISKDIYEELRKEIKNG
ncbi:nucleic acid-binding protein [Candidatus Epulonipiscium fishelsonii]|uniref:Nucleic acid-binding protein n=1 Tax=Candidatus Epulonipiscium fishelsonii TaxID=77094 RepID=A0ACC8XHK1_9FIRM|nr:nucleic acid-binding protein [Epulopiscium sp. SCG-D08WGA-EpuloA1]OON90296.1 MAG: nucleic acid-binding protein [Epulopiscium sp. AS2M-Bin002]